MAHRGGIGHEQLGFAVSTKSVSSLDTLSALIDRSPVMVFLAPVHPSAKGEAAWPPLSMFKALLPSVWYDLSDVKLAEALDDRASFRRFCGFSSTEPVPDMRWRGIAQATAQLLVTAIAHNLKRTLMTTAKPA
jgi:transposase, IS5 family